MKKVSINLMVLVLLFAAAPFVVNAREGSDDPSGSDVSSSVEQENETETEHLAMTSTEVERSSNFETKRQEREARLAEKKAKIAEKLAGKRAELCEKKASRVNNILSDRGRYLQTHMNKFNAIRDRIVAFVAKKQLSSDQLTTLEAAMNDAQANAQAAIDTFKTVDFVCSEADATNPGGFVKDAATDAKDAVKAYRTAIKEYAQAARALAQANETTASDDETADQGTGDATGGTQ